jgi:hypothetical protein
MKKTSNYYGTYMRVLQETQKKTSGYYGNYMRVLQEMLKNPTKTMDPYAGIATNDKCQQLWVAHMRVLQEMPRIPAAIMGLRCGYCKGCQKLQQLLWDLDAGIALNVICL